jgi:hypothetical protein
MSLASVLMSKINVVDLLGLNDPEKVKDHVKNIVEKVQAAEQKAGAPLVMVGQVIDGIITIKILKLRADGSSELFAEYSQNDIPELLKLMSNAG